MAGQPGKSGGARAGAGRKPKEPEVLGLDGKFEDPKDFLRAVMNDVSADARMRVDAAKALMPFEHQKMGEGGKKEAKQDAAKKAGGGKFAAAAPPRLVVNNGK